MRSEEEVITQILQFANDEQDIRLVAMNGSRVNKNIPADSFSDYDVVFFTDDVIKYTKNKDFLKQFGEILIMTAPDDNDLFPPTFNEGEGFIYLVLFTDGVRIDMQFRKLAFAHAYINEDSLTRVLLDKDKRIKTEIIPSDRNYHVRKPSEHTFQSCVDEFWWQYLNTIKSHLRGEFLLAVFYLNLTRNELNRLLVWKAASEESFDKSYGKEHHKMLDVISADTKNKLLQTFDTTSAMKLIRSLKLAGELFQQEIQIVGSSLGFSAKDHSGVVPAYLTAHGKTEEEVFYIKENY